MNRSPVPRIWQALLSIALRSTDRRFGLADVAEEYERRVTRDGARLARRWYRRQVAGSLVPLIRLRVFGAPVERNGAASGRRPWGGKVPDFLDDFRYAFRTLAHAPLVVGTTILSLGLGIAVATTIFTVANALLYRSAAGPSTDPDALVTVYTSDNAGGTGDTSSFPDYRSMVAHSAALGGAAALEGLSAVRMGVVRWRDDDVATTLLVEIVTGNYFDVLSVPAALGRTFGADETRLGSAEPLVVISHRMWRDRFLSDPTVIGAPMLLDGVPFTIIGVAPEGLAGRFLSLEVDAWLPLGIPGGTYHATPTELADRDDREYLVMGRLRDGASVADAQAQLAVFADSLHEEHGSVWEDDLGRPRRLSVYAEADSRVPPDMRAGLLGFAGLLLVLVGMILFIACSNVAGMLLARATARSREMAVRLALGASRARIVRLLLSESLLLGLGAGALGALLARRGARLVETLPFPVGLPLKFDFSLDHRVLLFAVALSICTSVVFGIAPALEASKPSLVPSLKTVTGATGRRRGRISLRNLLVIGQVAVSLVFLVGAGLMIRTIQITSASDLGINPERIASTTKWLDEASYPGRAAQDFFDQVEARLAALPDVEQVHSSLTAELSIIASVYRMQVRVDGFEAPDGERTMIGYNSVTPGYLEMLEVGMRRGRTILDTDVAGSRRVAVVNEAFAERYWPGANPVGRVFQIVARRGGRNMMNIAPETVEVVGVAANAPYGGLETDDQPYFWMPIAQDYTPYRFLHVKGRTSAEAMVTLLQREVPIAEREVVLIQPTTYAELIGFQFVIMSAASTAFGYTGAFALLLATIGIYGIVSFAVSQRRHEMAVRQALGAMPGEVRRLVIRDGMFLAGWGLVVGLVISVPISLSLASDITGLSPVDPLAVGGSVALLVGAALVASAIPARRVTRIDPMETLRQD